ncbi:MAG: gephyrin-like molybdotransferase Glp [Promethearchaeota archaeon]
MERLRKIGFSKLTSLEDAIKKLDSHIKFTSIEEIQTSKALNRILADDIVSNIDIPPFERAAMDGYALKAKDTFEASLKNPKQVNLVGKIEVGGFSSLEIDEGEAIRISTGSAIPKGADTVIKIEDTEREEDIITLYTSLVPGKNISKKGEDILKGNKLLNKGIQLKAEHIALLSSSGFTKIKVRVRPKVSVYATGDELIELGIPLEPNKIYNSNTPMITSLTKTYGGSVIRESTLKDDKEKIKETLLKSFNDSDIVVFTGGTSVGTKDLLPEIVQESATILIHGVAMRPGSPILIGYKEKTIIFCLPGTPVAAYIGFLKFVGITIRKMLGCLKLDPRIEIFATLKKDVPVSSMGYIHHLRVRIEKTNNEYIAFPVKLMGSGVLSSLTKSDGIIEIPPYQEGLKEGTKVMVKLFP